MALWGKPKQPINSTQEVLTFSQVHDGIIITKTGELRAILMVSSINFALKSEQEQNAIIFAYQNFLNSLNFPIQIVMQSKRLDLSKYIEQLKEVVNQQTNELLRLQTVNYIDFIQRLITIANIMDKKFYVVVPFTPPPKMQSGRQNTPKLTLEEYNSHKIELDQRVKVVISGLASAGLRSAQLNTQQAIELIYRIYNPEEGTKQKLVDFQNLTSQVIESELEKPMESKADNKNNE